MNGRIDDLVRMGAIDVAQAQELTQIANSATPPGILAIEHLSRQTIVSTTQRSVSVVAGILDGLSVSYRSGKPVAKWASIVARVGWLVAEAATPQSIVGAFINYWYGLALLFSIALLTLTVLGVHSLVGTASLIVAVLVIVGANTLWLRTWMLGKPGRFDRIPTVSAFMGIGVSIFLLLALIFLHTWEPMIASMKGGLGVKASVLALLILVVGVAVITTAKIALRVCRNRLAPRISEGPGRVLDWMGKLVYYGFSGVLLASWFVLQYYAIVFTLDPTYRTFANQATFERSGNRITMPGATGGYRETEEQETSAGALTSLVRKVVIWAWTNVSEQGVNRPAAANKPW